MTLEGIKEAISELSVDERDSLAAWIIEQDYDTWDRQMVTDFSPGGQGFHLLEKIKREVNEGNFTSLEQAIRTQRKQP
jgi:hypothetical protein